MIFKRTTEAHYKVFCRGLVAGREAAGITQVELADRLGIPQSVVSKMESGIRRLDVVEFLAVAEALGLDPSKFVRELEHSLRSG